MKTFIRQIFAGKDLKITAALVLAMFALVVLGCFGGSKKSSKPIPSEYFGDWKGQDGSTLAVRGDGSGDFRAGSFKVENGSVEINDEKKELSFTFFGVAAKTLKIDQAPTGGDQMKLGGVLYSKTGNFSTSSSTPTTSGSKNPFGDSDSNSSAPQPNTSGDSSLNSEAQSLVQKGLQSFADAVEAGDFTDFYNSTSSTFKKTYTVENCNTNFDVFIKAKDRVVPIIRSTSSQTPTYSLGPTSDGKTFQVNGSYPTSPSTQFEFRFVKEDGGWKIIYIRVRMV